MTDKQEFLLELAVFCLALIAMATLNAADALPAVIVFLGFFAALGIAVATGVLVCYEIVTFDTG